MFISYISQEDYAEICHALEQSRNTTLSFFLGVALACLVAVTIAGVVDIILYYKWKRGKK